MDEAGASRLGSARKCYIPLKEGFKVLSCISQSCWLLTEAKGQVHPPHASSGTAPPQVLNLTRCLQAGDPRAAHGVFRDCQQAGHEPQLKVHCQLISALAKADRPNGKHSAQAAYDLWEKLFFSGQKLDAAAFRAGVPCCNISMHTGPCCGEYICRAHVASIACHLPCISGKGTSQPILQGWGI